MAASPLAPAALDSFRIAKQIFAENAAGRRR